MVALKRHFSGAKSKKYFVIFNNKEIPFGKKGNAKDLLLKLKRSGIKAKLKVKLIEVDTWNQEGKLRLNKKPRMRKIIHDI